jgi:thioredoxin-related protein
MKFGKLITALVTSAILACAPTVSGAPPSRQLQAADDLAATARQARANGVPILLAFTETGCPYCARARNDYLLPLQAGAAYGAKVIIREIDIRRDGELRGFSGEQLTPRNFSRRYRVSKVPTVIVVDHAGNPLAEPVVGLLSEDFYQSYLERAIDAGYLKLKR